LQQLISLGNTALLQPGEKFQMLEFDLPVHPTPAVTGEGSETPDVLGWRQEYRRLQNCLFPQFTVNTNTRLAAEVALMQLAGMLAGGGKP